MKRNQEIRQAAKEKGVFLWQIAERLGIQDTYLTKLLRREFTPERRAEVLRIIDEIAAEGVTAQ